MSNLQNTTLQTATISKSKNTLLIPMLVLLVASFAIFSTVFLPYASATESRAEFLAVYSDEFFYEELKMTNKDVIHISMIEYANIYSNLSEAIWGDATFGIFYIVLVALIALFSLLTLLFSVLKKPIPVLIFNIINFSVFSLQNWDYSSRGVIPSSSYDWGIAYYIFFASALIILCAAIWLLISKLKIKKQAKIFIEN